MPDTKDVVSVPLVIFGDPDQACVSENVPDFIKSLTQFLRAEVPLTITNVTIGNVQPLAGEENNLWIRRSNSGGFLGFYQYVGGAWTRTFPIGVQHIAGGDSRDLSGYSGYILANSADSPLSAAEKAKLLTGWLLDATGVYYTIFDLIFVGS